jgi:hypothetical protein
LVGGFGFAFDHDSEPCRAWRRSRTAANIAGW